MTVLEALPVEVLLHIFSYLPEVDPDIPLRLCALNRRWRELVPTSSALWTSLRLPRHQPKRKGQLWLERSRRSIKHVFVTDCTAFARFDERSGLYTLNLRDIFVFLDASFTQPVWKSMNTATKANQPLSSHTCEHLNDDAPAILGKKSQAMETGPWSCQA